MIARIWRGWAGLQQSDAYEVHYRTAVLERLPRVDGYAGAQLLRRNVGDGVELISVTYFAWLDAIRAFAGANYEVAVVAPEARRLLSRFDEGCSHYGLAITDGIAARG
jgi:hypothetical protein